MRQKWHAMRNLNLFFLQMSLLKSDYAYAWQMLSMQTAVLCYTPPLNNG